MDLCPDRGEHLMPGAGRAPALSPAHRQFIPAAGSEFQRSASAGVATRSSSFALYYPRRGLDTDEWAHDMVNERSDQRPMRL
jgi:hypothetical protein